MKSISILQLVVCTSSLLKHSTCYTFLRSKTAPVQEIFVHGVPLLFRQTKIENAILKQFHFQENLRSKRLAVTTSENTTEFLHQILGYFIGLNAFFHRETYFNIATQE